MLLSPCPCGLEPKSGSRLGKRALLAQQPLLLFSVLPRRRPHLVVNTWDQQASEYKQAVARSWTLAYFS